MAKLDEVALTAIVAGELRDAINFIDEEVGPLRAAATDYYFGRPLGNEEPKSAASQAPLKRGLRGII